MKNIHILSLIIFFFTSCKKDTDFTFKGKITDNESGKPIANVKVSVHRERDNSGYFTLGVGGGETFTNIDGDYLIKFKKEYNEGVNYNVFAKIDNYSTSNSLNYTDKAPNTFVNNFILVPMSNVIKLKVISKVADNSMLYCFQDSMLLDKVGKEKYFYSRWYKNSTYEVFYAMRPVGALINKEYKFQINTNSQDSTSIADLEIK